MKRRAFLAGTGVALGSLAGCVRTQGSTDQWDVTTTDSKFRPARYEASVGETVVWHNTSQRSHTVTAYQDRIPDGATYFASGGFDSEQAARDGWKRGLEGAIHPGESFEHTFETPGTYRYFCIPHEVMGMVGSVVVTK